MTECPLRMRGDFNGQERRADSLPSLVVLSSDACIPPLLRKTLNTMMSLLCKYWRVCHSICMCTEKLPLTCLSGSATLCCMTELKGYFTIKEAANVLGVHRVTVHRWLKSGKAASVMVASRRVIPENEIERLKRVKCGGDHGQL